MTTQSEAVNHPQATDQPEDKDQEDAAAPTEEQLQGQPETTSQIKVTNQPEEYKQMDLFSSDWQEEKAVDNTEKAESMEKVPTAFSLPRKR